MSMNEKWIFIEKINLNLTRILLIKFIAEKDSTNFLDICKNTEIMQS